MIKVSVKIQVLYNADNSYSCCVPYEDSSTVIQLWATDKSGVRQVFEDEARFLPYWSESKGLRSTYHEVVVEV